MTENKGCTHKWIVDNHNVGTCSLCGEIRKFPLEKEDPVVLLKQGNPGGKRGKRVKRGKHRRYDGDKAAIITDLLSIGRAATCQKWNIPKTTLNSLIFRWLTPEQKAALAVSPAISEASRILRLGSENSRLPHLPEFSNTWEPPAQLKWLEIYDKLIDREEIKK